MLGSLLKKSPDKKVNVIRFAGLEFTFSGWGCSCLATTGEMPRKSEILDLLNSGPKPATTGLVAMRGKFSPYLIKLLCLPLNSCPTDIEYDLLYVYICAQI